MSKFQVFVLFINCDINTQTLTFDEKTVSYNTFIDTLKLKSDIIKNIFNRTHISIRLYKSNKLIQLINNLIELNNFETFKIYLYSKN